MMECRHCREFVRGDPERIGARCPRCRMPLYEKGLLPRRPESGGEACPAHPANQAIGPCQRCGTLMCTVCRTRWYDQNLCSGCIERAIEAKDTGPQDALNHRRQALLSLLLSLGGWALLLLGGLPLLMSRPNRELAFLETLLILGSFLPALFGVGQALTALRTRGQRMVLACSGLALAGSQLGLMVGFALLNVWHN